MENASQQGLKLEMNPELYRGLPVGMLNLGGTTAVQFGQQVFFKNDLFEGEQKLISEDANAFGVSI